MTRKREPNAKCSIMIEDDAEAEARVFTCSSVGSCYNFGEGRYDNTKCNPYESCGSWETDNVFEGCVLNKYCGIEA